jgi:prephenate dehydrogenase
MTVQMTVIGLGQLGTSIGLALAGREELIYRVGHDREISVMNKAKALKAFDATHINLPASVEKADLVVLCLPLDQVEDTLKYIAADLREDAVVLDLSPLKSVVAGWFAQHVPAGRHYIGLVPAINPLLLMETAQGIEAARADLFNKATIGIAAPANIPAEAIKLAEDFVRILGGEPLFLDMLEADGMVTTTHILPQVLSVALLNATVGQPGWDEARRFANRPFAQGATVMDTDTQPALKQALLLNPDQAVNALDLVIGALTHLRNAIKAGDAKDLEKRLTLAGDDYTTWLQERNTAKWNQDEDDKQKLGAGGVFRRFFLGVRPKKK